MEDCKQKKWRGGNGKQYYKHCGGGRDHEKKKPFREKEVLIST